MEERDNRTDEDEEDAHDEEDNRDPKAGRNHERVPEQGEKFECVKRRARGDFSFERQGQPWERERQQAKDAADNPKAVNPHDRPPLPVSEFATWVYCGFARRPHET